MLKVVNLPKRKKGVANLQCIQTWPQLFKRWTTLPTGQITIHWIAQLVSQILIRQGHPTTVFCKISFSEEQILPNIFFCLRTGKNFEMIVPFMYNFRSFSNKFPTIFRSLIFNILPPRLQYFSQKKET